MDNRYADYCMVDRIFYDSPARRVEVTGFRAAAEPLPRSWMSRTVRDWIVYEPKGLTLPRQGWKIHVSACLDNAENVLEIVWSYCISRGIAFKHLRDADALHVNNSKSANRAASGKFVTIYPEDEESLRWILEELGRRLEGQPGPYILSDLRWGTGPLYVRYGGFVAEFETFDLGVPEPAIRRPGGQLVPDRRKPSFSLPDWVELPGFLLPHLDARKARVDLPYRIEEALQFSNSGGVYVGVHHETGERVVLKEARPHAGLDRAGVDAVGRLERERSILEHLRDLSCVPSVRDYLVAGDHHFLVLEHIEGQPLNKLHGARLPLNGRSTDERSLADYTKWARQIIADVEHNMSMLWQNGVVFGDLHTNNIMVRPDGRTVILDFETASFLDENHRPALATPGFAAPADRRGVDRDVYALACLRLAMFLPLTTLIPLDPEKAAELAAEIGRTYPIPPRYFDEAISRIVGRPIQTDFDPGRAHPSRALRDMKWQQASRSMVGAILASATPGRDDRLFPGDIEQFSSGGLNIAHGAAGVLYAVSAATGDSDPAHERWLLDRAFADPDAKPGFYDGLHGVAYVLEYLGYRDEALSLIEKCTPEQWQHLGTDLSGGLAGIGLNLLHFGRLTGDPAILAAASQVGSAIASRVGSSTQVGLMHGSSGVALFFVRLFEQTGGGGYLELAASAIDQDLQRCITAGDGSLQVDDGWRTLPYLAGGSVGIGLVLQEFLKQRPNERYSDALDQIALGAQSEYYAQPGLFNGRAGMLLFHAGLRSSKNAIPSPQSVKQARRLSWHAVDYNGRMAFPGEHLHRLSMDLATGTAGVLLALAAVTGRPGASLPFLSPRTAVEAPASHR
ncbi:class III lanthionine synthetase LanKC [Kribbella sp. NPDC004536]|uniref:class III lanthionine synthetase LanKC n=1 Tax=Kribbella sp. NPDC004536 TaxID=3364106 RepID=UPI0036AE1455